METVHQKLFQSNFHNGAGNVIYEHTEAGTYHRVTVLPTGEYKIARFASVTHPQKPKSEFYKDHERGEIVSEDQLSEWLHTIAK